MLWLSPTWKGESWGPHGIGFNLEFFSVFFNVVLASISGGAGSFQAPVIKVAAFLIPYLKIASPIGLNFPANGLLSFSLLRSLISWGLRSKLISGERKCRGNQFLSLNTLSLLMPLCLIFIFLLSQHFL